MFKHTWMYGINKVFFFFVFIYCDLKLSVTTCASTVLNYTNVHTIKYWKSYYCCIILKAFQIIFLKFFIWISKYRNNTYNTKFSNKILKKDKRKISFTTRQIYDTIHHNLSTLGVPLSTTRYFPTNLLFCSATTL